MPKKSCVEFSFNILNRRYDIEKHPKAPVPGKTEEYHYLVRIWKNRVEHEVIMKPHLWWPDAKSACYAILVHLEEQVEELVA